jgi:hypothetical protein
MKDTQEILSCLEKTQYIKETQEGLCLTKASEAGPLAIRWVS